MHQEDRVGALGMRGMVPFVLRLEQLFAGPMLPCAWGSCGETLFLLQAQVSDSPTARMHPQTPVCHTGARY